MIQKIGICAPVEPGTVAHLRHQIAGHLKPEIEFDIYIVDPPLSVELDAGNYVSPLDSLQGTTKCINIKRGGNIDA